MARDFSAELNEFIAVVSAPLEPGETAVNRVERCWIELTDVIGLLVDDVDAENRDAELGRLKMEAVGAATRALAALPKLPAYARLTLNAIVPTVVPMAIDAAADQSSFVVKARDLWLVPGLDFVIRFLLRTRSGLAPDAPPLRIDDGDQNPEGAQQQTHRSP